VKFGEKIFGSEHSLASFSLRGSTIVNNRYISISIAIAYYGRKLRFLGPLIGVLIRIR